MQDASGDVKEPFSWIVQQIERGLKVVLVEPWVPVDVSKIVVVGETGTAWLMVQHLKRVVDSSIYVIAYLKVDLPDICVKAPNVENSHGSRCIDARTRKVQSPIVCDVPSLRFLGRLPPETACQLFNRKDSNWSMDWRPVVEDSLVFPECIWPPSRCEKLVVEKKRKDDRALVKLTRADTCPLVEVPLLGLDWNRSVPNWSLLLVTTDHIRLLSASSQSVYNHLR